MTAWRRTDLVLLTLTLLLLTVGLVMLYSASAVLAQERYGDSLYFVKRQLQWALVGLGAMWAAWTLPYRVQRRLAAPALLFTLVALALVLVPGLGKAVGGARRWLALGPLLVQPAEFAKYSLLVWVASTLAVQYERAGRVPEGWYLFHLLGVALCALLIVCQPDLGTAVVLAVTVSLHLLVAGMPWRFLGYTAAAALPVLFWALLYVPFRLQRLLAFVDPWADPQGSGYQAVQAALALGQGGLLGVGLGRSQQKLFYLPEAHTDFIFAVVGEELGFIGTITLLLLYGLLLWRILRLALRCQEPFGTLLGLGVFLSLAVQISTNLGVVTGLLPTKGLPLPLLSLGGSNLVTTLLAIGTMLSVAQET
ncbi:MAG: cell division protein FtsW [Candidatus Tectimicrobiota bacterium]|nr:MAG: cell division protein FtsW [Candidatus Tectomicrobia bacterium]